MSHVIANFSIAVYRSPVTQPVVGSSLPSETSMMARMMTASARKRSLICLAFKVRTEPFYDSRYAGHTQSALCPAGVTQHVQQLSENLQTVPYYTLLKITSCGQNSMK